MVLFTQCVLLYLLKTIDSLVGNLSRVSCRALGVLINSVWQLARIENIWFRKHRQGATSKLLRRG